MHRLVIVSGPNRGSSYALVDGDNSIGRQMDNQIVLSSTKVSKRHCVISVNHQDVILSDTTSTNGTFVNGALVRQHILKAGDKISIGDFVLELVQSVLQTAGTPPSLGAHPPMLSPSMSPALRGDNTNPHLQVSQGGSENVVQEPTDPIARIPFLFETKLMPFFYGTLLKTEFRALVGALLFGVVLVGVVGSIMPMQDLAEKSIRQEGLVRAKLIAREVADRFLPAIANHAESQIDLSQLESEESVRLVAITNTNMQIIAPQSKINQMLANGPEAVFANLAAKQFREGRERGIGGILTNSVAVYVEPIRVTDPRQVKSKIGAMVVVAIDMSGNLMQAGGLGIAYGTGLVVAGLAALLVYFIILRLSFKPYEVLNDDLDQVLRGELPRVTHEFKIEETSALWNNINAAIQRIPRLGAGSDMLTADSSAVVDWDTELAAVRAVSEASGFGMVGFDSQLVVQAMNPQFEEISGIRIVAIGQTVQQAARDQAFISLVNDLKDRVLASPSRSAMDEFEFSGLNYQVVAMGVGPVSQSGLALVFKRKE